MTFDEWWETLPPNRPNRPRKVAREAWDAALASARPEVERRIRGQTIEQWAERAEISERNLEECINAKSK
jgi:hypothetical protein